MKQVADFINLLFNHSQPIHSKSRIIQELYNAVRCSETCNNSAIHLFGTSFFG